MRTGADPGRCSTRSSPAARSGCTPTPTALQDALAATAAEHHRRGDHVAVVVDTREQAAELNAAIRERLVADGRVDDRTVAVTGAGQRIGAGDRIATRRNDRDLGVANRDTWTVTAVGRNGGLLVTPDRTRHRGRVPAVSPRPAQGRGCCPPTTSPRTWSSPTPAPRTACRATPSPPRTWWSASTPAAASGYVGMTRGRHSQHRPPRRRRRRRGPGAVDRRLRPRPGRPRPRPRRRARRRRGRPLRPVPPAGGGAGRAARGVDGRAALPSATRLLGAAARHAARGRRARSPPRRRTRQPRSRP